LVGNIYDLKPSHVSINKMCNKIGTHNHGEQN
jgi:hypothetical protein